MITIRNEKEFDRKLKKFAKRTKKDFDEVLQDATDKMHSRALSRVPTGRTGKLRQELRQEGPGVIVSHKIYSSAVEKGTKPHWPNVSDLQLWVKKIISPPARELNSVTYLVGRKISKEGTDAQPFMRPAWEHGRNVLNRQIKKVL